MKVVFTTPGPVANTLCDVAASPLVAGVIEQLGSDSDVDIRDLYNQVYKGVYPRGNIDGPFVFTAGCSYATRDAATNALAAARALTNLQGTVVVTPYPSGQTLTMLNAVLKKVDVVLWWGVRLNLRYTFVITSVTAP